MLKVDCCYMVKMFNQNEKSQKTREVNSKASIQKIQTLHEWMLEIKAYLIVPLRKLFNLERI